VSIRACVFVHLQLENGYTDSHQTWHAYSLKPGRDFRKVKTLKSVLVWKPGEGGFCILETKHDRRTSPRPKLFVLTRRLQKQRPQPRKTVLVSSLGEDGFRDNFFFCYIQRYVSNDQAYDKLFGNKD
jgi:hypothetical protein